MEMTGLQIFKYLPAAKKEEHSNCKECGCPTCMAFALKLAKKGIDIEKCPYIKEELKNQYLQGIKHSQKTVSVGNLKIGGENVLYRHEKTFINRTLLAVCVDFSKPEYTKHIERICNFEIKGVKENYKVDLIIAKNCSDISALGSKIPAISYEEYQKLEIDTVVDTDFHKTKDYLITTRTKAIKEKDESCSNPVSVWIPQGDLYDICTKTSYYICKYANMIVFEDFDEAMFSTLVRLRENIYTDPQKPLQVESALYEFNSPDENSIIFLTTNFALTYFAVANELEGINIPTYLIVIPADGMSVLTAWSAEKFTAKIVAQTLEKLNIREKIKTRKIIIPGLLAHITDELKEEIPDFDFIVGTNEASEIREYIKNFAVR